MPEKMERALRQEALKRKLKGKRKDAFIYGTMNKQGETINKDGSHNGDKD